MYKRQRRLRDAGYADAPPLSGLGYRQLLAHLRGETTLDEAITRIKFETHRFARQQATWFRADDPRIAWFEAEDSEGVVAYVAGWLEMQGSGERGQ